MFGAADHTVGKDVGVLRHFSVERQQVVHAGEDERRLFSFQDLVQSGIDLSEIPLDVLFGRILPQSLPVEDCPRPASAVGLERRFPIVVLQGIPQVGGHALKPDFAD